MSFTHGLRHWIYRHPTLRREVSKAVHRFTRLPGIEDLHTLQARRRIQAMRDQPPGLYIETTDICNAECITCPYPNLERPKGVMDMDLFKRVADDAIASGVRTFSLFFLGEPLVDKLLFERIRYIKQKCPETLTWINTNGSLLTEEKCNQLIDSGLDSLQMSMDGFNPKTFESIRIGLKYDKVVRNFETMSRIRRERAVGHPRLSLFVVGVDSNRDEVGAIYRHWKDKVDSVSLVNAHNWASQTATISSTSPQSTGEFPGANPCLYLWNLMVVLWDGRVGLCCMDSHGKVILGDFKTQSLGEIWNGDAFNRYRQAHLEKRRNEMDLCKSCSKYTLWWTALS